MFDRLSMLEFACFMDLNIVNWVKSASKRSPWHGATGVESGWEKVEELPRRHALIADWIPLGSWMHLRSRRMIMKT